MHVVCPEVLLYPEAIQHSLPLKHRNGVSRGIATGINNLWFVGLSEQDKLRYFGLSIKSIDSQFRGGCQAYNIMQPHIVV